MFPLCSVLTPHHSPLPTGEMTVRNWEERREGEGEGGGQSWEEGIDKVLSQMATTHSCGFCIHSPAWWLWWWFCLVVDGNDGIICKPTNNCFRVCCLKAHFEFVINSSSSSNSQLSQSHQSNHNYHNLINQITIITKITITKQSSSQLSRSQHSRLESPCLPRSWANARLGCQVSRIIIIISSSG